MLSIRAIFFFLSIVILLPIPISAEIKNEGLLSKAGIQSIKSGTKAPNFSLEDLNGRRTELRHYRGKVIFLNFWATWCGPCKEEMPSIEALSSQFKGQDFALLTISVDYAGEKPVKEFIEKHRYTFPVLIDSRCLTLDLFRVKGIPTTFLIDKKGMLIGKAVGPRDWNHPEVKSLLKILVENDE